MNTNHAFTPVSFVQPLSVPNHFSLDPSAVTTGMIIVDSIAAYVPLNNIEVI